MTPKCYSYVRFSTPDQARGDSLRRQVERSREYAEQKGLELDESLNLQDLGLSAFKGLHKTKGALGEFIRLVEEGRIAKGSVLIVESLDRLSREQVLDALSQFTTIIRRGIKVVTLADNMEYDERGINANFGQLLMSLVIMSRAYEESLIKSRRLKSAWEHKRKDLSTGSRKVLTAKCPAWMRLHVSEDRSKFILIPEGRAAVELIFKKKLAGKGALKISKELNQEKGVWKPPSTRRNSAGGWRESYIIKILNNKAVIGEFQPHKMVKDDAGKEKRTPSGDPISNYYPKAIDESLFYQVQDQIRHNRETNGYAGGRTGKCNNLFTHIAKCGYCGGPMRFVGKGKLPKSVAYFVCGNSKQGQCCKSVAWRYDEFEADILKFISFDIDVSKLLPGHEETQNEISLLQQEKSSIQGQLNKAESEIANLSDTVASTGDRRIRALLEGKLADRLDEKERLQKSKREAEKKIDSLKRIAVDMQERISNMRELAAHMQRLKDKGDEEALIAVRLELRQAIRAAVDEIKVFPSGFKDRAHVNELESPDKREVYYGGINNKDFRFYRVSLKGCREFSRGWYSPEAYQKLQELQAKREEECGFFPEFKKNMV